MDSAPLTLKEIEEKACELFFPNGKSHFGSLQDMSRVVANSAGDAIISFPGSGTIADYLSMNGLYPSLTYLYLRTIYLESEENESSLTQTANTSVVDDFDSFGEVNVASNEDLPVVYPTPLSQHLDEELTSTTSLTPPKTLNFINNSEYRPVCPTCFCTSLPGEECLRCKQDEEYTASLSADRLKHMQDAMCTDDDCDREATLPSQDEIRMHRIAYLSRNVSLDGVNQVRDQSTSSFPVPTVENPLSSTIIDTLYPDNEITSSEAATSIAEQHENQQEAHSSHPPSSPDDVQVIKVHRSRVCKDMISHFQDEKLTTRPIVFEIIDDRGKPEKGAGIGVARDVFSLFWKAFGDSMTIGERERVPYVRHDHFINEWRAIGRILVQGYKMVSYFPMFLSRAFVAFCLFGDAVPDSVVITSFKNYLSVDEEKLVENCLSADRDENELQSEEVVDFLECFNCRTVLNEVNCQRVITEIAKQELIQKPHIMLSTWQPILAELKMFEPFQSVESLEMLYESIKPTNKKVLKLLVAQPSTEGERDALKFLQRYIRGLDTANLGHFLCFTTGADIFIVITVSFVKLDGVYKTPVAHTCGPVLELPSTYQDFCELREVFNNVLGKSDWNIDIV